MQTKYEIETNKNQNALNLLRVEVEAKINYWKQSISEEDQQCYREIDSGFGLVGRNLGKYPVIFITFSNIIDSETSGETLNYETILESIRSSISNAYKQHSYLRNILHNKSQNEQNYNEKSQADQVLNKFNRVADGKDEKG